MGGKRVMRIRGKSVRGGCTGGRAKRKDKGEKDEEGGGEERGSEEE